MHLTWPVLVRVALVFLHMGFPIFTWENYTAPNVLPLTIAPNDHPEC